MLERLSYVPYDLTSLSFQPSPNIVDAAFVPLALPQVIATGGIPQEVIELSMPWLGTLNASNMASLMCRWMS